MTQGAGSRAFSKVLREKMEPIIAKKQTEFKEFKKEYGSTKIAEVTVA